MRRVVGGEAKTVTLSPDPGDAVCEWAVENADYEDGTFRIGGLEITRDGDSFTVGAAEKTANTVTVNFKDTRSGKTATCDPQVIKPAEKQDEVDLRSTLLIGGTYNAALDANCDGKLDVLDLLHIRLQLQKATE